MASVTFNSQLNYSGRGYIDGKMQPVSKVEDLNKIPRSQRFIGLTVTVLNDGIHPYPVDYWIKDSSNKWSMKETPTFIPVSGDDVETL